MATYSKEQLLEIIEADLGKPHPWDKEVDAGTFTNEELDMLIQETQEKYKGYYND